MQMTNNFNSFIQMNSKTETLVQNYQNPTHPSFLKTDIDQIYKQLKLSHDYEITFNDIIQFRNELYDISRAREQRILRGEKKFGSYRQVRAKKSLLLPYLLLISLFTSIYLDIHNRTFFSYFSSSSMSRLRLDKF